ncbi:MAG: CPXCG motif-containing cysteine-rich protein [Candidatus Omnitrophica bacterium]|nr:CPXCG motif-containing cysteine-rich protein [Candidatus Omnitrophota bacterium]MDD5671519.1 CPXCG motif-containing cysteine-rich protein [Candidatus Omnitrophota bacterium]
MLEDELSFLCPYCSAKVSMNVDLTGGRHQSFDYDCDQCCRPIVIRLETDDTGVTNFSVEQES